MRLAPLTVLMIAGCAVPRSPSPSAGIPLEERAQALNEVIGVRYGQIGPEPPLDACAVYLALDRDPAFAARLGDFARGKLRPADVAACPASADAQRRDHGWFVRTISRRGRDELTVTADANAHGGHRETFILRHGYGDPRLWRVVEVRVTDFWYE